MRQTVEHYDTHIQMHRVGAGLYSDTPPRLDHPYGDRSESNTKHLLGSKSTSTLLLLLRLCTTKSCKLHASARCLVRHDHATLKLRIRTIPTALLRAVTQTQEFAYSKIIPNMKHVQGRLIVMGYNAYVHTGKCDFPTKRQFPNQAARGEASHRSPGTAAPAPAHHEE